MWGNIRGNVFKKQGNKLGEERHKPNGLWETAVNTVFWTRSERCWWITGIVHVENDGVEEG